MPANSCLLFAVCCPLLVRGIKHVDRPRTEERGGLMDAALAEFAGGLLELLVRDIEYVEKVAAGTRPSVLDSATSTPLLQHDVPREALLSSRCNLTEALQVIVRSGEPFRAARVTPRNRQLVHIDHSLLRWETMNEREVKRGNASLRDQDRHAANVVRGRGHVDIVDA